MKIISLIPHLSEKTLSGAIRRYSFRAPIGFSKPEIKKEIEKNFQVKIEKLNTSNYRGQKIKKMRFKGKTKSYQLVLVTLEKGQKIAGFEMPEENKGKQGIK